MKRFGLALFLFCASNMTGFATMPDERLKDAAEEQRALELTRELRCMVCQNQSIEDSDAPLARDLRLLVREKVAVGESNEDIRAYLVARYGDFILLRPSFNSETLLLWAAPLLALLAGLILAVRSFYRRR